MRCSSFKRRPDRRWWRAGRNGGICAEVRRSARRSASAGGRGGLRERSAGAVSATRLSDLFGQTPQRDRRDRGRGAEEKDQSRKISDFQPAVRDAGAGGAADFEGVGSA